MEFLDVVRSRRSTRQFLPRDVPDDVVNELLDAGRLAPTPGNAQGFYFGVVRDPSTKRELAKAAGGQDWVASAPVVIALCARLSADLAAVASDNASLELNRLRFGDDLIGYLNAHPDRRAMRVLCDNAIPMIAGEHVFLAAVNRGLSACWIGHLDTRSASGILRLPDDMVCLFLMPIGYPADAPGEKRLRSLSECVFQEAWPVSE
jgi:nitroreductase